MSAYWLELSVVLPAIGTIFTLLQPSKASWYAAFSAVATIYVIAHIVFSVLASGEPLISHPAGWQAPIGIELQADGLAALFLTLTALISSVTACYASSYIARSGHELKHFWTLVLLLWTGLNALFLSRDAFNIYITLEVVSLAGVSLTALSGNRDALKAALTYLFAGMLASFLYLLGISLLYLEHETLSLAALGPVISESASGSVATALITGGLLFKGALVPLHFWLPAAHSNAPAPVSALLSALVVKAALYLLMRWWLEVFSFNMNWNISQFIGVIGAAAVIWGGLQALAAARMKLLIAYSTVAQMGYLILLFPLGAQAESLTEAWSGVIYLALAHGLAKAAMFLAAGNVIHLHGHDRLHELNGLAFHMPLTAFAIAMAGISLIGLPFSGGFIGKWLLLSSAINAQQWWWIPVLLGGSLLSASYIFRLLQLTFLQPTEEKTSALPLSLEWPPLVLAAMAVALGICYVQLSPLIESGAATVLLRGVSR